MTISTERLQQIVDQGADLIWIAVDGHELFDALSDLLASRSAGAEGRGAVDPSQAFANWVAEGPKLAKAAGVYVGIKVYDKEPTNAA